MRKIKQTVRTILLCGFLFAYTDATFAQITLSVKQQPVREVIKEIERISDYRFFYNENSIPMEKRVTVNVKDSDIENVLNLSPIRWVYRMLLKTTKSPYPLKSE